MTCGGSGDTTAFESFQRRRFNEWNRRRVEAKERVRQRRNADRELMKDESPLYERVVMWRERRRASRAGVSGRRSRPATGNPAEASTSRGPANFLALAPYSYNQKSTSSRKRQFYVGDCPTTETYWMSQLRLARLEEGVAITRALPLYIGKAKKPLVAQEGECIAG